MREPVNGTKCPKSDFTLTFLDIWYPILQCGGVLDGERRTVWATGCNFSRQESADYVDATALLYFCCYLQAAFYRQAMPRTFR
jgi:hypothetical protein